MVLSVGANYLSGCIIALKPPRLNNKEKATWDSVQTLRLPPFVSTRDFKQARFRCPDEIFFVGCKYCVCDPEDRKKATCKPSKLCPLEVLNGIKREVENQFKHTTRRLARRYKIREIN